MRAKLRGINRNIMEFKVIQPRTMDNSRLRINRNIMEFKVNSIKKMITSEFGINRNIMEFKDICPGCISKMLHELIEI